MSAEPKPVALLRVPDDLTELDHWLLWRIENVGARETKVPYSVRGCKASSTDPRSWAPFDVALTGFRRWTGTTKRRLVGDP